MSEMDKLEKYLKEHGYKYEKRSYESIAVYDDNNFLWSVDSGKVGYLLAQGEIFRDMTDNLTADEVISRLEAL